MAKINLMLLTSTNITIQPTYQHPSPKISLPVLQWSQQRLPVHVLIPEDESEKATYIIRCNNVNPINFK